MNVRVIGNFEQIIPQRFTLLVETPLHKFQEFRRVAYSQRRSIAGQGQRDQRRMHFRRRTKRSRRNAQRNFRLGVELAQRRQISVVANTGMRGDALGDFQLNHDVDRGDLRGPLKKMVQDRRSNVVRQIAVDVKTFAAEFAEVGLQHVTVDNLNTGPGVRLIFDPGANSGGQVAVGFDGDDAAPVTSQQLRQFAMAWANF